MNTKVERPEVRVEILRILDSSASRLACSPEVVSPAGQELASIKLC